MPSHHRYPHLVRPASFFHNPPSAEGWLLPLPLLTYCLGLRWGGDKRLTIRPAKGLLLGARAMPNNMDDP